MPEYDDVVESVLVEEEQAIEQAQSKSGHGKQTNFAKYVSVYITLVSLIVAVAALVTAFAADQWMEDALADVADSVDFFTLRVEKRCNEIQGDLAALSGRSLNAQLKEEMQKTAADLAALERNRKSIDHDAFSADRVHYVTAIGITLLQMATALAAVMGVMNRPQLFYASAAFACMGILLTIVGVARFLA